MANTRKTKAQLIEELEVLRARVESLEYSKDTPKTSGEYLRAIAENAPVGIGLHRNGIALYVNSAYVHMFGYDDETELIGGHFTDLVAPRFREELDDRNRHREPGEATPTSYEGVGLRKDGSEFLFHVQVVYLELPEGAATAGFFTDITERKQEEKAVRQAEERYREIYENAIEGIFQSTPQGTFSSLNPAMAHIYGYDSPAEMLAKISDISHQVHADSQTRAEFARLLNEKGKVEKFEARNLRKDGSIIWTSTNARAVRDESGAIAYYEGTLEDITERKQAEDRLMLLKLSIDAASDGVYWMDTEGRFLYVNETGCKALGYSQDELLQMRIFDVNPRVTPERWAGLWKALRKDRSFSAESVHRRKDGSLFPVEIHSTYLQFGGQEYCNGFAHDITGRRQAQKALRESEELYRSLFENMLNGFAYCKMLFDEEQRPQDFVYLSVNNAFEALTGLKNVVGKKVTEVIPSVRESDAGLLEICGEVALSGKPVMFETYVEALKTWLSVSVYSPEKEYFVSVFDVITERKQADAALRESEERYRALAETSHDMIFVISEQGVIEYANKFAASQFGLQPEAIIGKNVAGMFWGQEGKRQRENIHKVLTTARPVYIEAPVVFPDGEHWLGTWLAPLKNKTGQATSVVGVARDLTDRVRIEEALRESEERNRIVSELTTDYAFIVDVNSQGGLELRWASDAMTRVTGRDIPDVQTMDTWKNVIIPEDQDGFFQFIRQIIATRQPGEIECRSFRGDETIHWLQISVYPKVGEGGSLMIVGAVKDITERKRANEEMQRRNIELATLNRIGQALNRLVEPAEMLELIFDMIGQVVDNQNLYIALYDEATRQIRFPIYTIDGQRRKAQSRTFSNGLTEYVLRTKAPLWVLGDLEKTIETLGVSAIGDDARCFLAAPMLVGDKAIGVIAVQDYHKEGVYQSNHVEILMTIASQAASALENARLYQHAQQEIAEHERTKEILQRRATQLAILSLVGEQIVAVLELEDLFARATQLIHAGFGYHHVGIFTVDREHGTVVMKARCGAFNALFPSGHHLKLGQGMVGWTAQQGERLLANDVSSEPRHVNFYPDVLPTRSELSVPIRVGQEVVGVLDAQSPELNAFDHNDVMVLETLAGQIAAAIENARLYGSVQQELAERKRAEQALQKYREHLEELVEQRTAELSATNEQLVILSNVKDTFVSNVSHELRTPIASLKLFAYLMDRRPEKRDTYIASLKREINRLEKLIEGVLMLSRLDQHRISANPAPFDLNALAQEYVTDRTPLAEGGRLTLMLEPAPDLPPVEADRQLIGEVLSILLTNAFNYTPAGGRIGISTQAVSDGDKQWLGFSVADSGPGIPPEEQGHMFERFYRGKVARDSGTPGTGLGLAIASEIIDLHHGRIEVHSDGKPGCGARFSVWLPANPSKIERPATKGRKKIS